jgi:hypothetical protein
LGITSCDGSSFENFVLGLDLGVSGGRSAPAVTALRVFDTTAPARRSIDSSLGAQSPHTIGAELQLIYDELFAAVNAP